jgi:class 3 adenylate cyclase
LNRAVSSFPPSPTPAAPAYLLVHHGGRGAFAPRRLTSPLVTIGRVPGNDVVLDSPNVSRRHAKLLVTDLGVTAHDLDSHNGVFINGKKVRSAPVGPGDLLYVGDVCLRLERDESTTGLMTLTPDDLLDDDDPAVRRLDALQRAVVHCGDADDGAWTEKCVRICSELVDAAAAVLVEVQADGDLLPTVVLPDDGQRTLTAVLWPLVQKAVASLDVQFAADLKTTPVIDDLPDDAPLAVMAVPLLLPDADAPAVRAVLYLARPAASATFDEEHLETIHAIAGVMGMRLARASAEVTSTGVAGSGVVEALQRIASLEEDLSTARASATSTTDRLRALEVELQQQRREASQQRDAAGRAEANANELRRLARAEGDAVRADLDAVRVRADEAEKKLIALNAEAAHARDALPAVVAERDGALARLGALERELTALRGDLDAKRSGNVDAFRSALRASVPPMLVEHVEAVASGSTLPTTMQTRALTALHIGLSEFDAFCERAAPEVVKSTLDRFCAAVAARAAARGGRVQQVVGHAHLVVFGADSVGAEQAVRCALDLDAAFRGDDGAPGIAAGVHNGSALSGVFGNADATSYVEAGSPVVVARAASEHAPTVGGRGAPRGVVISEVVRALVAHVADLRVTRLGPVWIPGVRAAVPLAVVENEPVEHDRVGGA